MLRIEDLDGPRIKAGSDRELIEDMRWLGLNWDGEPIYQSSRFSLYQSAINRLIEGKRAYACVCSRREAALAASAPHSDDHAPIYSGRCRGRFASPDAARDQTGRPASIRFAVPNETITFTDEVLGAKMFDASRELGDFVIAKADGTAAYQLAVVLDDAAAGVTHVVRGDDLLDSTPRQILLYRAMGLAASTPTYCHLPLVIGTDGRRLAKRHGDTRLASFRESGVPAVRVLRQLAVWLGVEAVEGIESAAELVERFDLSRVPREPIVWNGVLGGGS